VVGAVVLAALYGISDECHQLFVPGRQFDVRDMVADALRASACAGVLWAWGIIRRFIEGPGFPGLSRVLRPKR
jgi:VanZ family protein